MSKLLIDTNIVLDLLAKREPFYESSAQIFTLADRQELVLGVSSLTIANTNYVLSWLSSGKEAREILRKFKILVQVKESKIPVLTALIDIENDREIIFGDVYTVEDYLWRGPQASIDAPGLGIPFRNVYVAACKTIFNGLKDKGLTKGNTV